MAKDSENFIFYYINCKLGQDFLDRQLNVLCKIDQDFLDIQPYSLKTSNIQMPTKKSSYSSFREYYENSEYFILYIKSFFVYPPQCLLGDPEVTANLYCKIAYLYWEGCVICSIYLR